VQHASFHLIPIHAEPDRGAGAGLPADFFDGAGSKGDEPESDSGYDLSPDLPFLSCPPSPGTVQLAFWLCCFATALFMLIVALRPWHCGGVCDASTGIFAKRSGPGAAEDLPAGFFDDAKMDAKVNYPPTGRLHRRDERPVRPRRPGTTARC